MSSITQNCNSDTLLMAIGSSNNSIIHMHALSISQHLGDPDSSLFQTFGNIIIDDSSFHEISNLDAIFVHTGEMEIRNSYFTHITYINNFISLFGSQLNFESIVLGVLSCTNSIAHISNLSYNFTTSNSDIFEVYAATFVDYYPPSQEYSSISISNSIFTQSKFALIDSTLSIVNITIQDSNFSHFGVTGTPAFVASSANGFRDFSSIKINNCTLNNFYSPLITTIYYTVEISDSSFDLLGSSQFIVVSNGFTTIINTKFQHSVAANLIYIYHGFLSLNSVLFQNSSTIQTLIELSECESADFVNVTIQKNFYTSGSYTAYIKSKSSTLSIIDSNISSNLFRFGLLNIMDTELYIFNSKFE